MSETEQIEIIADEKFMNMSESEKEIYLEPYAKRCKKCNEIYPRNKKYFKFNSQSNPILFKL